MKVIFKVGSSILRIGKASSLPISQTVSPTEISGNPAIAIISPAWASFISILLSPKKPNNFWILNCLILPSNLTQDTISFSLMVPDLTKPIPILPT